MTLAHILGFPRIGAQRELKTALERFWRGESDEAALAETGRTLRARHWAAQRAAGLDLVTVGDFSFYDHVLDMAAHLGALPARFGRDARGLSLADYFVLARGGATHHAMEMTKWFDTNYHYLVPELKADTRFEGGVRWVLDQAQEAIALGHRPKVVLVGPLTFLHLSKAKETGLDRLALLPALAAAYGRLLRQLAARGVEWVQLDEPCLAGDLGPRWLDALDAAYAAIAAEPGLPKILLATYFGSVAEHAARLKRLPVAGLHLDLHRAPEQLAAFVEDYPAGWILSAGVVDGRNVWRCDLEGALERLRDAHARLGERLWVSASCSLLHVPVDAANEAELPSAIRDWIAFAQQKLDEIVSVRRGLVEGAEAIAPALAASRAAQAARRGARLARLDLVRERMAGVTPQHAERRSPYSERRRAQAGRLKLPLLPTTTIGSFPQTAEIRQARAAVKRNALSQLDYLNVMRAEVRTAIERQTALGLDMLVHGEPERNDMVEYFAERLRGMTGTANGWVQSYGSRCVKPPILYGDVYRPEPMTVGWAQYAQSLTDRPVKGMLTGPVTMLQWSFVRDDQPRADTALQLALALRDEVMELEKAGLAAIQIDEPAFREGLPLKRRDWQGYFDWAVRAFRVSACGVDDATQIHTHMCYSEFNDILDAVAALDADVITIETSRSDMELLDAFRAFAYPNEIGPGVYDIHSPRVPAVEEMERLLAKALEAIPAERLWVNPDCGLKTRAWPEVERALRHMVEAARRVRARIRHQGAARAA